MCVDTTVSTIPFNCCDAEEDEWLCTLDKGHDGPHEAHGFHGRLMCRWWNGNRFPRQDLWREYLVQDLIKEVP